MARLRTTIGSLLVNEALPEGLRDYERVLDKKSLTSLLSNLASDYPEKYRDISFRLNQIGRQAAYSTGGHSFGLRHIRTAAAANKIRGEIQKELTAIDDDDSLSDEERERKTLLAVGRRSNSFADEIFNESAAEDNPLALQIISGARGNKTNLASLRGGDLLYTDHRDRVMPVPVLRSYSQGLSPAEYWAGAYGARKGVVDTKLAIADAGYLGKQLSQMSHRAVVVDLDGDGEPDTLRGYPVSSDDPDNEGALLSAPVGGYPRNTVLTPKILADLRRRNIPRLLVRSPITGGSPDGGVYARDVGVREFGRLPQSGEQIGLASAQALAEPLAQGSLCLAAGTLVRMADWSTKPIEKIVPGDSVLGSDETGTTFPVRVLQFFRNGEKACYETAFRPTFQRAVTATLTSTLDHKILAVRQTSGQKSDVFNDTAKLYPVGQVGRDFAAQVSESFDDTSGEFVNEPFAALIGALLGDGCYTKAVHGCYFKCHDPQLIDDLAPHAEAVGVRLTQLKHHAGTYYRISQIDEVVTPQDVDTGQFAGSYRNPVMRWLNDRGMLFKYAHEKRLPPEVHSWNNASIALLLGGLFATDGSIFPTKGGKPGVNFGSTSKELVDEVEQLLAWRFGIYGSRSTNPYGDRKRPMFYLDINHGVSLTRFLQRIPLLGRKRLKVADYLTNWTPADRYRRYDLKRVDQRFVGTLPTYDIEVDHPAHLFVLANGLIVSNSSKHSGGVASSTANQAVSGFKLIDQLVQVPKTFKGGAAHAELDGTVSAINDAPAGGKYVTIGGQQHYVHDGFGLKVRPGDRVEAGDVLSEGIPNPAIITAHKGVGEGRRYFIDAFRKAYKDAGIKSHRRNIEVLARSLVNHVRLTDEVGDYAPDDVVPYGMLEASYQPREGSADVEPRAAVGQYLEKPYLHYTVGTKVRPSMLKDFDDFGVTSVSAHRDPPPFEPEMIRGMQNLQHDPDWMTRMFGSGLKGSLLHGVARGGHSDEQGTSFVPGLAKGVTFGQIGQVRTPKQAAEAPSDEVQALEYLLGHLDQHDTDLRRLFRDNASLRQGVDESWAGTIGNAGTILGTAGGVVPHPGAFLPWLIQLGAAKSNERLAPYRWSDGTPIDVPVGELNMMSQPQLAPPVGSPEERSRYHLPALGPDLDANDVVGQYNRALSNREFYHWRTMMNLRDAYKKHRPELFDQAVALRQQRLNPPIDPSQPDPWAPRPAAPEPSQPQPQPAPLPPRLEELRQRVSQGQVQPDSLSEVDQFSIGHTPKGWMSGGDLVARDQVAGAADALASNAAGVSLPSLSKPIFQPKPLLKSPHAPVAAPKPPVPSPTQAAAPPTPVAPPKPAVPPPVPKSVLQSRTPSLLKPPRPLG
jgi:hypothetical protein